MSKNLICSLGLNELLRKHIPGNFHDMTAMHCSLSTSTEDEHGRHLKTQIGSLQAEKHEDFRNDMIKATAAKC